MPLGTLAQEVIADVIGSLVHELARMFTPFILPVMPAHQQLS